jgi:hypothetical protein
MVPREITKSNLLSRVAANEENYWVSVQPRRHFPVSAA